MDLGRVPEHLRPALERLVRALHGDLSPTGKALYADLGQIIDAMGLAESPGDQAAFIERARATMKACRVGARDLGQAHDILADCYGTIGRLIGMTERAENAAKTGLTGS